MVRRFARNHGLRAIKGKRGYLPRAQSFSRWHGLDYKRRVDRVGIAVAAGAKPVAGLNTSIALSE